MRLHPAELDVDSLRYLREVDATAGDGHGGIFVRRPPDAGPRGGWGIYQIAGVVALGIALALFHPSAYERLKVPALHGPSCPRRARNSLPRHRRRKIPPSEGEAARREFPLRRCAANLGCHADRRVRRGPVRGV